MTAPRILDPGYRPQLTANGHYMLRFRYLKRNGDGQFEAPVVMFRRVAWTLAQVERQFNSDLDDSQITTWADRFFTAMTDGQFLPNAPTLLGAGRLLGQLFACFVLPVDDSIDSIFDTLRMAAQVHSKGGGTGFSFSRLRARGTPIATGGVATGPVSFMEVFDRETEAIKSGGTGWGANMGVLRCDHPDILEFVSAKAQGALRNFNISVAVTDQFMDAAARDEDFALVDPHTQKIVRRLPARFLLHSVCEQAWRTGDPGLLFIDQINANNPTPALGAIEATNPCGEAPLLPFEACCLGGINVAAFHDPDGQTYSWDKLEQTAGLALRMMDNVIQASRFPLPEIHAAVHRTRKLGIGVMGFADLLIAMGIAYDSPEAEALAGQLMTTIQAGTRVMSQRLAATRGPFPAYAGSRWQQLGHPPMRNATTTSNAPNSTISAVAGCSAGIEPHYSIAYSKHLANGEQLREVNQSFVQALQHRGLDDRELMQIAETSGSVQDMTALPDDLRRVFVTAHDISPAWHIRIQAAFQQHTDLGVSKTINLPHTATVADVRDAFLLAYQLGCKGITCYRDRCQEAQFLSITVPRIQPASQESCSVCT
ncbi:MAG: adenosylcobalamin-dependent ribonucleoside-diphosphate reductase [Chloroflexota bacterium]|nr:adenosylcobalamin-dependent ribonucleoside-diphosphate reductase [Chloroflexota bacterium]